MTTVIGNIRRAPPGKVGLGEPGELVVDGDTIEFRGTKATIRLTGVRAVSREGNTGIVNVFYGSPEAKERFMDFRRSRYRTNSQAKVLVEELRSLLGHGSGGGTEQPAEVYRARMKAARTRMLVAAAILVVGLLVTIITFSRASRGGGTFIVAWGAILAGAAYLVIGLVEYTKASGAYRRAGGQPGSGSAAEPIPDVAALKAARDVDGLVAALRHNELQVRIDVMAALEDLREPRAVELLIDGLRDPRWDVRWSSAEALGKLGDPRAVEPLRGVLHDDNALVRAVADKSITALQEPAPESGRQPS